MESSAQDLQACPSEAPEAVDEEYTGPSIRLHEIKHENRHVLRPFLKAAFVTPEITSLAQFETLLEGALLDAWREYPENLESQENEFLGQMFEVFVELFLAYFGSGEDEWPKDYTSRHGLPKKDMGADGCGRNFLNQDVAVQIKYRRNADGNRKLQYSGDHIANLIIDATRSYDIPYMNLAPVNNKMPYRHCVVSNVRSTTNALNDAFEQNVITILRSDVERVDDHAAFWAFAAHAVEHLFN